MILLKIKMLFTIIQVSSDTWMDFFFFYLAANFCFIATGTVPALKFCACLYHKLVFVDKFVFRF